MTGDAGSRSPWPSFLSSRNAMPPELAFSPPRLLGFPYTGGAVADKLDPHRNGSPSLSEFPFCCRNGTLNSIGGLEFSAVSNPVFSRPADRSEIYTFFLMSFRSIVPESFESRLEGILPPSQFGLTPSCFPQDILPSPVPDPVKGKVPP